ncbi:hypothetical protein PFICI_00398 [Pestalotiopsis fici W106-1]|uniref:CHAT domain-containing protein n=1 Tax=Pestalotiopsis fici (strain W106-1 / CGMCC3.15140) TaxID=1229662 RepID=W3XKP3_PESFW|nr:uncharacterized protein PFICI_00398 [Pestalotiopsis fici W106-1]ETS86570.1 hypothetical protein PFICI_00398 [Pestalotiopsis fici W106-1]
MDGPLTSCKPFLAYLSACSTGQVRHDELVDEGIHPTGACQLAGFQHVIDTLWEVNDKSCVEVKMTTYQWIQNHAMTDAAVSEGLHRACRELRGRWMTENSSRAALRRRECEPIVGRQSRSIQDNMREARDVEADDDVPLYWVPYVHFGI